MSTVSESFVDEFDDVEEVLTLDGVRISFTDNSWVLSRATVISLFFTTCVQI